MTGPDVRCLVVALEADRPLAGGARYALAPTVRQIVVVRGPERELFGEPGADGRAVLRLPGRSVSALHARLSLTDEGWVAEDAGSTNGTFVNGVRCRRTPVGPSDVVEIGHSFLLLRSWPHAGPAGAGELDSRQARWPPGVGTLVPGLADQLERLMRIARATIPLMLLGETGTGKELLSRAIHAASGRTGPFVAVNCGALTDTLAQSQLFGHVRGAFSGAVADTPGFIRAAEGGTLLLDEVADLDLGTQAALLRVLQENEVVPVGSVRTHRVNVRFIATSPVPLKEAAQRGRFRSDLLARLEGYAHQTAPLRERREDLGVIAAALLRKMGISDRDAPTFSPELALAMFRYRWPRNVRELEQVLGRAWALASGGSMTADALPAELDEARPSSAETPAPTLSPQDEELQEQLVRELQAAHGNVSEVARSVGKARAQVHRWMKRFRLRPESFRRR
jgi:DNA-binding NtrC family response regulator